MSPSLGTITSLPEDLRGLGARRRDHRFAAEMDERQPLDAALRRLLPRLVRRHVLAGPRGKLPSPGDTCISVISVRAPRPSVAMAGVGCVSQV